VTYVNLDCRLGDEQRTGDVLVREPFANQVDYLDLAWRKFPRMKYAGAAADVEADLLA
jgi:hypothetical protein